MSSRCTDCHFLAKFHDGHRFSWEAEERANRKIAKHFVAECAKGVWTKRLNARLDVPVEILKDRGGDCFFIPAYEGMFFDTATELFRLRNDNRQLKKSHWYTQSDCGSQRAVCW